MPITNPYGGYLGVPTTQGGSSNPYGGFITAALANKRAPSDTDALLQQIQKMIALQGMQQTPSVPNESVPIAPPTPANAGVTVHASPNPFNVGNVRPVGSSTGFQQPNSFDEGVALAVNNVKAYPAAFNKNQPMNLIQIGEKWAPKGDGANDPKQWALNVSKFSGLPADTPLDFSDPRVLAAFAKGVHGAEWGGSAIKPIDAYLPGATSAPLPPSRMFAGDVIGFDRMLPRPTDYSKKFDEIERLKKLQGVPAPGNENSNIISLPRAGALSSP